MQILFTISVLSFFGITWAAIAFARHIKAGQLRNRTATLSIVPARPDFKHHLLNAPLSNVPAFSPLTSGAPTTSAPPIHTPFARTTFVPERPTVLRTRSMQLHQSAKDITARKQWTMPTQSGRPQRRTLLARITHQESAQSLSIDRRKPPLPARHGTMELLDPAYFNKDLGDLTDPYQPTPVRVNERAQSSSRRKF